MSQFSPHPGPAAVPYAPAAPPPEVRTLTRLLCDIAVLDLLAHWTPSSDGRPSEWLCSCARTRVWGESVDLAEQAELRRRIASARDEFLLHSRLPASAIRYRPS